MDDGPVGVLLPPQADASRRSRTTDTSPIPPAPRTPITSYGPIREPGAIAMTDEAVTLADEPTESPGVVRLLDRGAGLLAIGPTLQAPAFADRAGHGLDSRMAELAAQSV